jgi:hypothetical protein
MSAEALRELLEYVTRASDLEDIELRKLEAIDATIAEALFFFPEEIRKLITEIRAQITMFMLHLKDRQQTSIDDPQAWQSISEQLSEATIKLLGYHTELALPPHFVSTN